MLEHGTVSCKNLMQKESLQQIWPVGQLHRAFMSGHLGALLCPAPMQNFNSKYDSDVMVKTHFSQLDSIRTSPAMTFPSGSNWPGLFQVRNVVFVENCPLNIILVPADLTATDEFRFYVECTDASLSFEVDHAYAVDNALNQSDDDDYLVNNHDFEQGDAGWIAPSLTIIGDGTSPSGNLYAKVSGRTQSSQD